MTFLRRLAVIAMVLGCILTLGTAANANYFVSVRSSLDPSASSDGRIVLLSPTGTVLSNNFVDASSLNGPTGLAILNDQLYVANSFSNQVLRFPGIAPSSSAGNVALDNTSGPVLNGPAAIRFDSSNNLFIANGGVYFQGVLLGNSVTRVDGTTSEVTSFGSGHYGPDGLIVDGSNNVYVSQFSGSLTFAGGDGTAVKKYSPTGSDITPLPVATGISGAGGAAFNGSTLLIPSSYDDSVYQYDGTTTTPLFNFGAFGFGPGTIFPSGVITVDSDTILVNSSSTATIFQYDYPTLGNPLGTLGVFASLGGPGTAIGDVIFTTAVPEPGSALLLTLGAAFWAVRARKTRQLRN